MKTASLLLRLSRESREESTGLVTQEADLRRLAGEHGLTVLAVHTDDGESGSLRKRPGFLAWLDDGRSGRATHLLADKIDRVSRGGTAGIARFLDVVEGLNEDGERVSTPVRFLSSSDRLDSESPGWDIQVAVLSALAKSERDLIRGRILRSKRQAKTEGRWLGGTVPAGFRAMKNPDGPGKVLLPDPTEVEVLREAARLLMTESLQAATAYLNGSPLKPPRAAAWAGATTRQALTSQAAMAQVWSPSEARTIRASIAARKPRVEGRKRVRALRLLTGVVFCAGCRRPMVYQAHRAANSRARYQCQAFSTYVPCPARASAQEEELNRLVTDAYLDGWGGLDEVKQTSYFDEKADRLAILATDIEQLWAEVPSMPASDRLAAVARIEEMEQEQAAIEAEPVQIVSRFQGTGRTMAEAWEAGDVAARNRLLRSAHARIYVQRATGGPSRTVDPARLGGLEALRDPQ